MPHLNANVTVVRNAKVPTDGKLAFELGAPGVVPWVFESYLARGDSVISGLQTLTVTTVTGPTTEPHSARWWHRRIVDPPPASAAKILLSR